VDTQVEWREFVGPQVFDVAGLVLSGKKQNIT